VGFGGSAFRADEAGAVALDAGAALDTLDGLADELDAGAELDAGTALDALDAGAALDALGALSCPLELRLEPIIAAPKAKALANPAIERSVLVVPSLCLANMKPHPSTIVVIGYIIWK